MPLEIHNVQNPLVRTFLKLTLRFKVKTTVEVGAHEAEFSNLIGNLGICKEILAFEASPFVWSKFKNQIAKEVKYLNIAISDHSGFEVFRIQTSKVPHQTLNNSILSRPSKAPVEELKVPCLSLVDLLPLSYPIALWVDAEGANGQILQTSSAFLNHTALVYIEVEHKPYWDNQWLFEDVCSFLKSNGFKLYRIKEQSAYQSNCIFLNSNFLHKEFVLNTDLNIVHKILPKLFWILLVRSNFETIKRNILRMPFGAKLKSLYQKLKLFTGYKL